MGNKIARFFRPIGKFLSVIIPLKVVRLFKVIYNSLLSGYISGKLKHCGKGFSIESPCYYQGLNHITIGDNFSSFAVLRIEAYQKHLNNNYTPELIIGNNVSVNHDCHFGCVNKIFIGNNVLIASKVFITDHFHGSSDTESLSLPPSERKVQSRGPVIIEDNVWIGEGVAIMPGTTIGANCIIGANAVVTKSFPANSVIGGNPAKIIKTIQ